MTDSSIFKQLVINSLFSSADIQDEIKSLLFYDRITSESRVNKYYLVDEINSKLRYWPQIIHWSSGDWCIHHIDYPSIAAINCGLCGQYRISYTSGVIPRNMACLCDVDYMIEIMDYIEEKYFEDK